jgi:chitinase
MSLNKFLKGKYPLGVYYQSWSSNWASTPENSNLSKVQDPINIVILSFVNPSCSYRSGSNSWSGTGLDFSSDFNVIKGAIKLLQNRGIVVLLAAGGATYPFTTFNPSNIAALANDLGVDGIDIDWEPVGGASEANKLGPIIQQMRAAYTNGLLSLAGFSVGCYGQGEFSNATPASNHTGMSIPGLQSNGNQLDFINLMSYDASPAYDPIIGFKSYRKYYSGPILIGEEVPPEAWGGNIITLPQVQSHANFAAGDKSQVNGIFVWSLQKAGTPSCMEIINTANDVFKGTTPPTPTPTPTPTPKPTPSPTPSPSGNWISGTNYTKGQSVTYNGVKYTCNIDILSCPPNVNAWSSSNPTPTPTPKPTPTPTPKPTPTPGFSNWTIGTNYSQGQIVSYNGQQYRCVQSHTALPGWTPDVVPALWNIV